METVGLAVAGGHYLTPVPWCRPSWAWKPLVTGLPLLPGIDQQKDSLASSSVALPPRARQPGEVVRRQQTMFKEMLLGGGLRGIACRGALPRIVFGSAPADHPTPPTTSGASGPQDDGDGVTKIKDLGLVTFVCPVGPVGHDYSHKRFAIARSSSPTAPA